jgi:hypothetical protein
MNCSITNKTHVSSVNITHYSASNTFINIIRRVGQVRNFFEKMLNHTPQ